MYSPTGIKQAVPVPSPSICTSMCRGSFTYRSMKMLPSPKAASACKNIIPPRRRHTKAMENFKPSCSRGGTTPCSFDEIFLGLALEFCMGLCIKLFDWIPNGCLRFLFLGSRRSNERLQFSPLLRLFDFFASRWFIYSILSFDWLNYYMNLRVIASFT